MKVPASAALDHVVVNVRTHLDEARAIYRRLGFNLTQRGHHSIGTSNHLAMFQHNYLELLGYASPDSEPPTDLVNAPIGLRALALQPCDPTVVEERLAGAGLLEERPADFHRPVAHAGSIETARFRVLKVRNDWLPGGRIFYCHHYTPELIWRDEWCRHPNRVTDVTGVFFRTPLPADMAVNYVEVAGGTIVRSGSDEEVSVTAGNARISFMSPIYANSRLNAAEALNESSSLSGQRMVGLSVRTASLLAAREVLAHNQIPFSVLSKNSIVVNARDAFGVALIFTDHSD